MLVSRQGFRTSGGLPAGVTLIELLVAIAVLATLLAVAVPGYLMYAERARRTEAIGQIGVIDIAINEFALANIGQLPVDLFAVGHGGAVDPWGNPVTYGNFTLGAMPRVDQNGDAVNMRYDLYSVGRDGATAASLTDGASQDDIVRASDGGFVGLVSDYSRLD